MLFPARPLGSLTPRLLRSKSQRDSAAIGPVHCGCMGADMTGDMASVWTRAVRSSYVTRSAVRNGVGCRDRGVPGAARQPPRVPSGLAGVLPTAIERPTAAPARSRGHLPAVWTSRARRPSCRRSAVSHPHCEGTVQHILATCLDRPRVRATDGETGRGTHSVNRPLMRTAQASTSIIPQRIRVPGRAPTSPTRFTVASAR